MIDAVQVGSSCWTCCSEETKEPEPGTLKARACFHWKMAPGLVCLAASIVAVFYSLYWQTPSLCGAFVPSAASSIYLIYMGWDFQNLHTQHENNEQFKESLGVLKVENGQLQASNATLNTQLANLGNSLGSLQTENSTLQTTNAQLKRSMSSLEHSVKELEQMRSTLQMQLDAEVAQLNILHNGLSQIQVSAKQDHASFAGQLALFIQQIDLLQKTRTQFEKASDERQAQMSEVRTQTVTLLESAQVIKEIFAQISEWKDGEEVQRRLSMAQDLGAKVSRFHGQLEAQELQLEEQKNQIVHLKKTRKGFELLLTKLLAAAAELKQTNSSLAEKVVNVVQECKQYDLQN